MVEVVGNANNHQKKASVGRYIAGGLAGGVVTNMAIVPQKLYAPKLLDKIASISKSISQDEFQQIETAIGQTMKKSGLAEKGVEIIKATTDKLSVVTDIIKKEFSGFPANLMPERIKNIFSKNFSNAVTAGENALFASKSNKIIIPPTKFTTSFFHEAGHAVNANFSKIGKFLQKARPLTALVLPIMLIALWKNKKAPGEKPTGTIDKTTTFIKENAGKLTFATFLPTLIEEGMATFRGNKFAKQLLKPELAAKIAKTNFLAYTSYLGMAILLGLGVFLGKKLRDHIVQPKQTV